MKHLHLLLYVQDCVDEALRSKIVDRVYVPPLNPMSRRALCNFLWARWIVGGGTGGIQAAAEKASENMMGFSAAEVDAVFRLAFVEANLRTLSLKLDGRAEPFGGKPQQGGENGKEVDGGLFAVREDDVMKAVKQIQARVTGRIEDGTRERVTMADVGGLEEAKAALHEMMVLPHTHSAALLRARIQPPTGLLMYGAPGTGKTMLAKALSARAGVAFMSVDVAEIVRGSVGDSERVLAALFQRAKDVAPCVVFLDELQAAFRSPEVGVDGNGGGVGAGAAQLVSQLKLEMDGISRGVGHDNRVIVIGATNEVGMLDKDLLRAGRFDRVLHIPLPDAQARKAILESLLACLPIGRGSAAAVGFDPSDGGSDGSFVSDLACRLANKTEGCTGAELKHLCRLATLNAVERDPDNDDPVMEENDFFDVIPRVSLSVGDEPSKETPHSQTPPVVTLKATVGTGEVDVCTCVWMYARHTIILSNFARVLICVHTDRRKGPQEARAWRQLQQKSLNESSGGAEGKQRRSLQVRTQRLPPSPPLPPEGERKSPLVQTGGRWRPQRSRRGRVE